MADQELQKAEYEALNQEILENSNKVYLVLNICVTTTGALLVLGLGFNANNVPLQDQLRPYISLLPFAVILPSIILVESSLSSTVWIAGYLKVVHEKAGVVRWQTNLQKSRSKHEHRRFLGGLSSVFFVLAVVCLATSITSLFWIPQSRGAGVLYIWLYGITAAALLSVFGWLMRRLYKTWSTEHFSEVAEKWKKLLKLTLMKAIVYHNYGSPDVLKCEEIEKPTAGDNEVLIKVRAASVNPLDWHFMRGTPYFVRIMAGLRKPKVTRLGVDVAGQVEAVGRNVTQFKPGDEVFGVCRGAFAEYACASEVSIGHEAGQRDV